MPDPAFAFDGGPLTPLGRQIDDQIAAARVATPVKDVTQRRVPRVSIAELNQMDRDQLHERLRQAVANSDNRGPVQVVLDLIDLPRNLIFNAVAPSIAKANKEAGDSAALGLGRVTTSDILKDWGVENSVVRGIAGFVGDVALDPLTYAGPPGWGAKVITKTGSAALRKGGMAAIEAELKAVAAGAKAVNPEARRLVEAAMATKEMSGAERLAKLAGTERSVNALRPKVIGEFTNSKLGKAFSKVGLNELESAGGVLSRFDESLSEAAKLGDKVAEEQIGAARGFISKFGKGTEPGMEFGKDATSAVAHIPFTDISLRVPNFTLAGRTAASNLRIARETQQGLHAMAAADGILRGGLAGSRSANEIPDILRDINEQSRVAQQPVAQTVADLTQEIDKLRGADPAALGTRYPVVEHRGTFADIEKAIGAIDPGTVAGERGAGISKATIDDKLEQMVNGPRATGRGAFLTDNRAAYLSDPENGTKALLAHALREKRAGRYVIGQHGAITGLDPERLHVGDSWRIGDDTLEVLEKGDDGTLTLNWTPSNGESARQVRVGPDLTDVNGSKFKSMLPANEHSFVGTLPTMRDPNELTGPHRARVASQLTEAFGDKAFNSLPVMDAYARGWARAQGKTVEDFYKTLRIEKGGKPGEGALFDIPAWHGSPHQFDKFDISKIGTGEGAQVYGHGLYFSSSEDIAKWYRKNLADRASWEYEGAPIDLVKDIPIIAKNAVAHIPVPEGFTSQHFHDSIANTFSYELRSQSRGDVAGIVADRIVGRLPKDKNTYEQIKDSLQHVVDGLGTNSVNETRFVPKLPKGIRTARELSDTDRSHLFDIEGRLQWLNTKNMTPGEALQRVKDDLKNTASAQEGWLKHYAGRAPLTDDIRKKAHDLFSDAANDILKDRERADSLANSAIFVQTRPDGYGIRDWIDRNFSAEHGTAFYNDPRVDEAINLLYPAQQQAGFDKAQQIAQDARARLDLIDRIGMDVELKKPVGRIYKVELAPQPHELLDWDEPLGLQGPHVIDALEKLRTNEGYQRYAGYQENHTGKILYRGLASDLESDAAASKALKEVGIRGIKYKGDTSGVTNYVIFDDADIAVKEMFQRGGAKGMGKPRGSYEMLDNGERVIRALTNPNASTLPHEVAHDFYNLLPQMDPKLAEKAAKAVGAESHAASTVQHQENFARGFEDYLRTGKAPSSELKTVFENFKQWLVDIYRSIVGTPLEGKMNPELKAVFDEMLTKDKGPILSLDPEALKLRDTLVARQQELADLRRQQKEAVDSALGLSQLSQELTDTAIQSVKPDGSITSAEQLITLGQLKRQADAAAEYARAQKSIYESGLALRADLYDKWESPTVAASTMSQTRQELFDLANRDPELAEQLSMAYGRAAEANANMAQAIGAQVAQTAANTGDRVLREVAKRALGTSDDLIGTAPMMALSRAAAATLGDQSGLVHILQTADRVNRKAFGNRSGLLAGQQKFWKRILTTGDVAAQDATRQQKILAKALTEAGKSPDARMLEQADQLLSAEVWRLTLKNGAKYHLRDFADPAKPSQLMQVFMDARKDGLYAGERGKELRKSIRSLAEQEVQRLRELGDQELADELLGVTMDSYAPIGLMPDAQRELGRVGAIMGEAGVDKPKAKESFQIQRLTNQTRYTDAEGVRRRFFEGERDFADKVTQGQWQAWKKDGTFPQHILDLSSDARGVPDKAKADGFMQIVDDVKSFDELPEEVRLSSPSLPTDPFELESLRGSRLFWITGGTADKPFFDTRWSTVSSRRLLAHERASARRSMAKLLGAQGIQVRPGSLAKIVPGEEFTTKGGVKGQVIALPNNRTGVRIGDTVFRPVEQSAGINSIFKDAFGSDLHNWIVPEQTAEVVEGIMELGKEPGQLLKLFDHMTGAWRVATLTNPSWITNNMIGNTMLGLQQRLFTPKDIADYSKDAFALHWYRGEPDVLRRMSFDVGGQKVTGEQLWNELQRHNIVGNNLINKEAAAYATADIAPWSRPWETRVRDAFSPGAIQKSMQEIPSDLKYRMQVAADARRAEGAGPNAAVDALRSTVSVGVDRYMRWFGAPFQRLNSVADDSMRTVAYLAARRRGMDGPTAAKAVLDGFIDYGDLTRFESQYLRRIVPFYAWIRNNTAIQFKTLFENPKYAAVAPKLQQAMDEAFAGEQSVPQNMRPRWMQDALAVQLGTDPEKRQALMLMSGLPQEQLYKTLMGVVGVDGFQDMLKYFGNSTHPLFQTFYGVTAGVDPFSGRTIGESGDMTLPKFLLNQAVPAVPRAEQIIKSTGQGGAGTGVSRFLLGGKVQDFSQQRIDQWNLRELRKAETALRIKVARAERTGDDSLDLRAELLHVYSEMARRGVGLDTIPKWAMEELSAAGVGR